MLVVNIYHFLLVGLKFKMGVVIEDNAIELKIRKKLLL